MIKVIIAGTRSFDDYKLLESVCDKKLRNYDPSNIEVVSGGARGADTLGEQYAINRHIKIVRILPDWATYKRAAGFRRNKQMADYANAAIFFWDGQSKGTKMMIDLAQKHHLNCYVKLFEPKVLTKEEIERLEKIKGI